MDEIIELYASGFSIPQVSETVGVSKSTVRARLKVAGILRTRKDALQLASRQGRLGSGLRGKSRLFTEEHKANISKAKRYWGDKHAKGMSLKPNGYVEYTRGPNKGRGVHVVMIEEKIGRKLNADECVHHIDGVPSNNSLDNLALMTRAAHAKLHRYQEMVLGKTRKRTEYGRLC